MSLLSLDYSVLLFIQDTLRADWAFPFWETLTDLGSLGLLWILWALLLLVRRRTRRIGFIMLIAIAIDTALTNGIIKNLAARPRPFAQFADIIPLIGRPSDFSFPSGHAACSFAAAFTLWKLSSRPMGIVALLMASLIALSRLYLGVHYPSDILGGLLTGYVASAMALFMNAKLSLFEHLCPSDTIKESKTKSGSNKEDS